MSLSPDPNELLSRARADLRMGVPVVIDRETPLLVAAVETLGQARLTKILAIGGDVSLVLTARRAETLKAAAYDGDLARVRLPRDCALDWIRSVADPSGDLMYPMKGPLKTARGGDAVTHRLGLRLAKSSRLLPAILAAEITDARAFATANGLVCLDGGTIPDPGARIAVRRTVSARLPLDVSEAGRLLVFLPEDGGEEHYAIEIGSPDRHTPVLVRLHSACFTGDLLGSLKCDCGPQLRAALSMMGREGAGVLLYLNQEGRGIGLANKMRAYALQDQGFDTVEANHRLGFEDDERDFNLGATILRDMGFTQARLLTNNPRKVEMIQASGIEVTERVPLLVGENRHNMAYLATKVAKSGHLK